MNLKDLKIPNKINPGDTVAFISISGGRAGDADLLQRYNTGKARFEEIFGVKLSRHLMLLRAANTSMLILKSVQKTLCGHLQMKTSKELSA